MEYVISFKSGRQVHVSVDDGEAFVKAIMGGLLQNGQSIQISLDPVILIAVSDIEFIAPASIITGTVGY